MAEEANASPLYTPLIQCIFMWREPTYYVLEKNDALIIDFNGP